MPENHAPRTPHEPSAQGEANAWPTDQALKAPRALFLIESVLLGLAFFGYIAMLQVHG